MKRTIALFVTITGVEDQQAARRLTVLLAVMISALILRSAFLALAVTEQGIESLSQATPDSRAYLLMAGNLLGSGQPAESQFFDFGIGYALFLAATLPFGGVWLVIAIQLLLSTLAVGGIYVLGRRLNLEHNTALLGAVLSAISMTSINLSVLILSDTLFFSLYFSER